MPGELERCTAKIVSLAGFQMRPVFLWTVLPELRVKKHDKDSVVESVNSREQAALRTYEESDSSGFRPPQFKKSAASMKQPETSADAAVPRLKTTGQLLSRHRAQLTSEEDIVRGEDVLSERSVRVSEISRALVEEGYSCFDIWPLSRYEQDIRTLGGIAWTLDKIGLAAKAGPQELIEVVMRMSSTRYLAWVRDGSYGLMCFFGVAQERRFHAIVDRARAEVR